MPFLHLQSDTWLGNSPQSLTAPVGATLLVVCFSSNAAGNDPAPVAWHGVSLLRATYKTEVEARGDIYFLVRPDIGTYNLTFNSAADHCFAFWFRGVKIADNPVYHTATYSHGNNDSWSVNVNSERLGDLVVYAGAKASQSGYWEGIRSAPNGQSFIGPASAMYGCAWEFAGSLTEWGGMIDPDDDSDVAGCGASFMSGPLGTHKMITG